MMQRVAVSLARRASELRNVLVPASEGCMSFSSSTFTSQQTMPDVQLDSRDINGSLARLMIEQAKAEKKQDALKKDVMKIIDWLEDATPAEGKDFEGKLKDHLPTMDSHMRNQLFSELLTAEEMKDMNPALRLVLKELSSVGEADRIVEVAYRYIDLQSGKKAASSAVAIELVLPKDEPAASVNEKKAMLVEDMRAKGTLKEDAEIKWNVVVDPSILGGCVYRMGDVEVDCSVKSLQDEFFSSLSAAGVERVE